MAKRASGRPARPAGTFREAGVGWPSTAPTSAVSSRRRSPTRCAGSRSANSPPPSAIPIRSTGTPPPLPIAITLAASGAALADPDLGLNYAMVVHGEQRFSYTRPLIAGDIVTAQVTVSDIRDAGRNVMLTTSTDIRTVTGELVCTATSTIVERGL